MASSRGGGDRKKLEAGRNFALNNNIHHFSRWVRTYRPAVYLYGVGHRVAHNRVHDAPHNAVLFWGNDHVLEFNEVYRVCTETGDAGAFYIGRDWTQRGNVIRYNYFHDLGAALRSGFRPHPGTSEQTSGAHGPYRRSSPSESAHAGRPGRPLRGDVARLRHGPCVCLRPPERVAAGPPDGVQGPGENACQS